MKFKKLLHLLTLFILPILIFSDITFNSNFSPKNVVAETTTDAYTKKIVSVVYDNSGSMYGDRINLAKYSLKMLISILDSRDTLIIVPMNTEYGSRFVVDLSGDRSKAIEMVNNNAFGDFGAYTPFDSVPRAVTELKNEGMSTVDKVDVNENKQYWLVVLTDGSFQFMPQPDLTNSMVQEINGYANMQTIFLQMAGTCSITKSVFEQYGGHAMSAINNSQIVNSMKSISSMLSGRLEIDSNLISKSGNNVSINLNNYDFGISSVSVVAQNTSGTLLSSTYKGNSTIVEHPVSFNQKINSSSTLYCFSSSLKLNNSYFYKDKIDLTFSGNISNAEISILIEPALKIQSCFEIKENGKYVRVTPNYINQKCRSNDTFKVGYEVFEMMNNTKVNINDLFGAPKEKLTYANTLYNLNTSEIPLKVGSNEVNVQINILNGKYILIDTVTIVIEADPTNYRVEGKVTPDYLGNYQKALFSFNAFANGKMLTQNDFSSSNYKYNIEAYDPDGNKINNIQTSIDSTGTIKAILTTDGTLFGNYTCKCIVESSRGLTRELTLTNFFSPPPTPADFKIEGQVTPLYKGNQNEALVSYRVFAGNKYLEKSDFENLYPYKYKITIIDSNGFDVTPKSLEMIPNGTINVVINNENTLIYGQYNITCFITTPRNEIKSLSNVVDFYPPTPSDFTVEGNVISKYQGDKNKCLFTFFATANGEKLKKENYSGFNAYSYDVEIKSPNGASQQPDDVILEDDGTIKVIFSLKNNTQYGNYQATLKVRSSTNITKEKQLSNIFYPPTPSDFKVEGNVVCPYQNIDNRALFSFKAYAGGEYLKKINYSGENAYEYKIIVKNSLGNEITPESISMNDDGIIDVIITSEDTKIYGEYSVQALISSCEGITKDIILPVHFYPLASEVKIISKGENNISLTENQLKTNNKSFIFEVTSDNKPLYIDSSAFNVNLTIDGIDVTKNAEIKENKVTFIPSNSSLVSSLCNSDGKTKNVILTITPKNQSSIKYVLDTPVTFTLNKTLYKTEALDSPCKEFDRYSVENSNAIVYFKVSVDGIDLTLEELKEELANGNLYLDTNPAFWLTFLPIGYESGVTTFNNTPCVYMKIKAEASGFIGSLFGSFIFPNSKDVSLTYHGATGIDTFTITPVSFASRLWRWGIILLFIATIFHITCYLLGFVLKNKARALPKGIFITCCLDTSSEYSSMEVDFFAKKYNIRLWPKIKWHLFRLIPGFAFKDQKLDGPAPFINIMWKKGKKLPYIRYNFTSIKNVRYDSSSFNGTEAQIKFDEFLDRNKKFLKKKNVPFQMSVYGIKTKNFKAMFSQSFSTTSIKTEDQKTEAPITFSDNFYGLYQDEKPFRLETIYLFIRGK